MKTKQNKSICKELIYNIYLVIICLHFDMILFDMFGSNQGQKLACLEKDQPCREVRV